MATVPATMQRMATNANVTTPKNMRCTLAVCVERGIQRLVGRVGPRIHGDQGHLAFGRIAQKALGRVGNVRCDRVVREVGLRMALAASGELGPAGAEPLDDL